MIIYKNPHDIDIIAENLFKLLDFEDVLEVLKTRYCFACAEYSHPRVKELLEKQKIKFIPPLTLFIHDGKQEGLRNESLIINKIEGFLETNYLKEQIFDCLSNNNLKNVSKSNNNKFDDFQQFGNVHEDHFLSPAELLEKQKREYEEMEKEAQKRELEKKKEEEIKKKQKEEKHLIEENLRKKLSSERKNKEFIRKNLYPEPAKNDPESSTIVFRMPDGNTRERIFKKSWKILELYNYVNSLDNVLTEEDTEYDLITPFPMKVFDDYDATLEEMGLFPNAVLQVREK